MNYTLVPAGLTDYNIMHRGLKVADSHGVTRAVVVIADRSQTGHVDLKLATELQSCIVAIPAMLAVCRALVDVEEFGKPKGEVCFVCDQPSCPSACPVSMARAAIAKAGGAA